MGSKTGNSDFYMNKIYGEMATAEINAPSLLSEIIKCPKCNGGVWTAANFTRWICAECKGRGRIPKPVSTEL